MTTRATGEGGRKWVLLATALAVLGLSGCSRPNGVISEARRQRIAEERKELAHRPRRIILNNNGADHPRGPETAEQFLARRTTDLLDSHVDTISYSTPYSYRILTYELTDTEGLLDKKDHFEALIDFCREHDKEVFWSMRMNDTLDSNIENGLRLSPWKIQNRGYLMATSYTSFPYGWVNRPTWPWTAMDYEHVEVRRHILQVAADVCNRYDVDGIELDFWRWPVFFKPQLYGEPVTDAQREMMTDLMRALRAMTESMSTVRRPILISVRIPDSVGFCHEVGLDITRWLEEGLVDTIVAGGLFQLQPWEKTVELGRQYNVPVYACLSRSRIPDSDEAFRGEALDAWHAGVDGIYIFNEYDPNLQRLRELGDPDLLAKLPRAEKYRLGHMEWRHVQRVRSILRDGQKYFDPNLIRRWEPPLPDIFEGINVGYEPGPAVEMVYTNDRYKLAYNEHTGTYRLFDIIDDPHERNDLSRERPEVFEPMKQRLELWRRQNEQILYQ